jgi:uncharacterized protein (TIGR00369 family)
MKPLVDSPSAQLLGREILSRDPRTGEARVRYQARPEFLNRNGSIQGGFLAAMLDSATALALGAHVPEGGSAATIRLETFYHKPAKPGPLLACARVVNDDGRTARIEGELANEAGEIVATAVAEFRIFAKRA